MDSLSLQASPRTAYPLSPTQHAMLLHSLREAEPGVDIEQLVGKLHERLDPVAFARAWGEIAARHDVLRTAFSWRGLAEPEQAVSGSVVAPVEVQDWSAMPVAERESRFSDLLAADRRRGFDLAVAPLWRVTLLRFDASEWRMVWTYSHAILDGCFAAVLREVFAVYAAAKEGRTITLAERPTYREHILWLEEHLRDGAHRAREFWRRTLAGFLSPTSLDAVQLPRSAAKVGPRTSGHDTLHFAISREGSDAIREACSRHDLRVSVFVEAAWSIVLAAFSGEDDVVFGSTRACRRSALPGAEDTIGLFINTVPVRVHVVAGGSTLAWLRELRAAQVALRAFEQTPLVDIVASTELPAGSPIFETIIVFNDRDNDARLKSFGDEWSVREFELRDQTNFPFNVMVYAEQEIAFKLSYERTRFARSTVERVADLLGEVLEALGRRPDGLVGELPRVPRRDLARLRAFNDTYVEVHGPQCIHQAFESQVRRTPDAIALVFRDRRLTFRELDERANRVARELASLGVGPDVLVGVYLERTVEMICGLLGVLKAGGAYVPLDPSYPRDRVAGMIADARLGVVLTLERLRPAIESDGAKIVSLDGVCTETEPLGPGARSRGENLAYVIFTSGSTGRPKGVQVEHRNVANFFAAMDRLLGTTPGVWLALTSISFDISVLEIFWTLTRGFTVVLQEDQLDRGTRPEAAPTPARRPIGFSLFYFAADASSAGRDRYRLLMEGAAFADTHGFDAVWTPERHFHPFGGLYPNPSVTGAALAAVTRRVAIRAGSIVLPLHDPIRCAEEWSVVDNLSGGRVGLSFASGWHASDFALAPGNFKDRRDVMARGIEALRTLWRGDAIEARSGDGNPIQIRIYPQPVQREPPIWITASGTPETFVAAGRMGARVLTNLLVMKPEELAANVAAYRRAFRAAGHAGDGHVSLMLHTFVGEDMDRVRATVRGPLREYLRTSTDLIAKARWERTAFAKADDRKTQGHGVTRDLGELAPEEMDAILDHAFERYFSSAGLFGTPESCAATVDRLRAMGVDEIACLIDFGVDTETVLASLRHLDSLRRRCNDASPEDWGIAAQIRRHGVTHVQCTPSLLAVLAADGTSLSALENLRVLLVGGEPLPVPVVERVRPHLHGTLRNMYGPTETTVWSTSSIVEASEGVTIGRPVANTSVLVVDRDLRVCPIGVPGEVLIGGAGVVRGYLDRPELTAERFVVDPSSSEGGRVYRTGDIARWTPSGDLEFLGRRDQQVKVRGFRIELGEIEAVLGSHPSVRECVAISHKEMSDDARLAAYVVLEADAKTPTGRARTDAWHTIWDETYRLANGTDGALNTAGWKSSYDGRPIPETEMCEWVEATVKRIEAVARGSSGRSRILEIGCGTGMLLLRLASRCSRYVGIDFSEAALALLGEQVRARALDVVRLDRLGASELRMLDGEAPFDVVVLNSVVQYFPDAGYLAGVLAAAFDRLVPGGSLFVGDVRSLRHLEAFHASVELSSAPEDLAADEWRARVARRVAEEEELTVDPRFFEGLARDLVGVEGLRLDLKEGRAQSEMTRFRYDVVVRKRVALSGSARAEAAASVETVQAPANCTIASLQDLLAAHPAGLRVQGLPNARVSSLVALTRSPADESGPRTVRDLRRTLASQGGLDPDAVRALDSKYDTQIVFSRNDPGRMDVVFRPSRGVPECEPLESGASATPPEALTNRPFRRGEDSRSWPSELRTHLRQKLPEFMVPTSIVVVDALPRTANGKMDRASLPAPAARPTARVAPFAAPDVGDVERTVTVVFEQLLGSVEIGPDDNFFDLGANSLIMVQASVRLREALGRNVSLVQLFQFPTVRALSVVLAGERVDVEGLVSLGQERANARQDAIHRRRELRNVGRGPRWP